ncbi:hypothetical protein NFX46_10260 [Streptomyces phaeoluteigriseus]|uniref:Uncharacterized protein n=1 Tax=Streptomyces phaeoluteigriseus TaxID=114686 RepID=A0ABY4Z573_9ACTN|nr:hypothetical protein [Streptomyces phaeoluteigriseus]USQ84146.1 hypothetical protein NFX46_10260 [Streptomyces phaeoluteigriseus]
MTPPVRMPYAVTVDAGLRDLRTADHLLRTLAAGLALPEGGFGCTHLLRGERPRVVVSLASKSEADLDDVRAWSVSQGYEVTEGAPDAVGRAVLYRGADLLRGTTTVEEVLAVSAIDRVTVLGAAGGPGPATVLLTHAHVRPQWQSGELVLTAMPAAGGTLVPFEVPEPTPCCADH